MRVLLACVSLLAAAVAASATSCSSGDPSAPSYPTHDALLDPTSCQQCHADHYRDWSLSMHAYASDDPVVQAMIRRGQRETNGALGGLCVTCHAPVAVREGATVDGTNLTSVPKKMRGVTCFFCHSVDAVTGTHDDALSLASDGVMRGPLRDAVPTNGHASAYSPLHDRDRLDSAQLCGGCHDLVAGDLALERTYAEWQTTVFAHQGGATCGQCHEPQSTHLVQVAQAPGAPLRRYHDHGVPAYDVSLLSTADADAQRPKIQALLDSTLQSAICVGDRYGIDVILDNVASGHDMLSGGALHRRAWVELVAWANGQIVYQSGVVPDGTPVSQVADSDLWGFRECLLGKDGGEVLFAWQAVGYESFTLPAQVTFDPTDPRYYQTHVYRSFPKSGWLPTVPDRVTMKVRVQPISLEILDALIASGDLDPALRARMPTFDTALVEWTPDAAKTGYYRAGTRYTCVTNSALNYAADSFPAPAPTKCTP